MGNPKSERSARTSVTFPGDVYESLEIIARTKKVSLAWVIREAAERYLLSLRGSFRTERAKSHPSTKGFHDTAP